MKEIRTTTYNNEYRHKKRWKVNEDPSITLTLVYHLNAPFCGRFYRKNLHIVLNKLFPHFKMDVKIFLCIEMKKNNEKEGWWEFSWFIFVWDGQ